VIEGWQQKSLGDFINLKRGYDLPKKDRAEGEVPIYSSSGISDTHNESKAAGPGVITGRYGTIGSVFYSEGPFWPLNTTLYVEDFKGNYPRFVHYFLQTLNWEQFNDKSAVPGVNRNDVHDEPILVPHPAEQKHIAEVLSSLDEKIDLLQRQNATLEALAEALFRQHFIEEAKDDWSEEPLDQVANYLNGLACQKYPATNPVERLPVLKIKDLKNGLSDSSDWATSKVSPEYIVKNGDIIFSWSASLLVKVWDGPKCVLNQHLFKVTSDRFPDWFIYQWTKHHLDRFIAIAETKATTMGHIKRTDLAAAMVKVPDEQSLVEAEETFAPIHQKIIANNRQIATLTEQRDELLPKLMSGEVRVKFEAADA